jgi:molecular chaperone Hsp33
MLTVSRDIGLREPYVGSTELVSGEIAEDLSAYLVESEQIPAACGLGVLVDTDHSVKAAGGFLVQLMPGAPEELVAKLEDNIFMMDQLTTILDEDGADAILPQVMRDLEPETVLRHPMAYRCACSRARVEQALRQCGVQELQDMIADGKNTQVHCQFCDAEYVFTPAELQTLLDAENADAALTVFGAALPPRKCTFAEKITENPLTIFLASCIMSKLRNGSIAQPGEHLPYKQGVTGSSPVVPTSF